MSAGFANSFSALANVRSVLKEHGRASGNAAKKDKKGGQKDQLSAPREPKTKKVKDELKEAPKEAPKETKPKEEAPKKESKTISLAAEMAKVPEKTEKDLKKEDHLEAKVQKMQNDRTDRHDRSGKGQHVRKEGKGVGGWEESTPLPEDTAPLPDLPAEEGPAWGAASSAAVEPPAAGSAPDASHGEKTVELSEEEKKRREEEAKARELEEKQMTLDEYLTKVKKDKPVDKAAFNVRKVNKAPLANMIKATHKEEGELRVTVKKPAVAAPAPKAEKPKTAEKKPEKKITLSDTGFRMDNPAAREGGRGRGRGGRGEFERGAGGRVGRGFGRGRGREAGGAPTSEDHSAPQMDSEALFPALKSAAPVQGSPAAAAPEKAAEPAA